MDFGSIIFTTFFLAAGAYSLVAAFKDVHNNDNSIVYLIALIPVLYYCPIALPLLWLLSKSFNIQMSFFDKTRFEVFYFKINSKEKEKLIAIISIHLIISLLIYNIIEYYWLNLDIGSDWWIVYANLVFLGVVNGLIIYNIIKTKKLVVYEEEEIEAKNKAIFNSIVFSRNSPHPIHSSNEPVSKELTFDDYKKILINSSDPLQRIQALKGLMDLYLKSFATDPNNFDHRIIQEFVETLKNDWRGELSIMAAMALAKIEDNGMICKRMRLIFESNKHRVSATGRNLQVASCYPLLFLEDIEFFKSLTQESFKPNIPPRINEFIDAVISGDKYKQGQLMIFYEGIENFVDKEEFKKVLETFPQYNPWFEPGSAYFNTINFDSLIDELIAIGQNEKFIAARPEDPSKYDGFNHKRAREIGEIFEKAGGMDKMSFVYHKVKEKLGTTKARELESCWGGIGDWMS